MPPQQPSIDRQALAAQILAMQEGGVAALGDAQAPAVAAPLMEFEIPGEFGGGTINPTDPTPQQVTVQPAAQQVAQAMSPPAPPAAAQPAQQVPEGGAAPPPAAPPSGLPDQQAQATRLLSPDGRPIQSAQPVADPMQQVAPPAPADDAATHALDYSRLYQLALGHEPTADEVVQTLDIATRLAALPEQHRAWAEGIMSGRINPAQIEQQLRQAAQLQQQPPAPPPAPQPAQRVPQPGDYDYDPFAPQQPAQQQPAQPAVDPRLEWERQQFAQERALFEQQQAQFRQQRAQQIRAGVDAAWEDFRASNSSLTVEEIAALQLKANQSQLFGPLMESTGNPTLAMRQVIDNVILNDAQFRDRILGGAASIPATPAEQARQNANNALASTSTSGAVGPTPPPQPGTSPLPAQQPVQPGMSPLNPVQPQQQFTSDMTRGDLTLALAAQIQAMQGSGG